MGQRVGRNVGALLFSQLTTWGLTLLLTIFLPRYLGAAPVGKFQLANSIWAVVAVLVTFGMDVLLTKEIARAPEQAGDLFGTSVVLRALLYLLGLGAVFSYLRLCRYPQSTIVVALIVGLASLVQQFIGACQATLQGLERMEYMAVGNIAGKAVNTAACLALLLLGRGVYAIAAVAVVAALVSLSIHVAALVRLHVLRLRWNLLAARRMLRAGLPYLLSGLFLVAYGQVDVMIISLLVDDRTVGWYGAASQLFSTLLFIPSVLVTAIFPVLSRLHTQDPARLPGLLRRVFDLLLVLSVPIGLGLVVVADPLVSLLFGPDFAPSGPVLALLGVTLIVTYQNMLVGQYMISIDRQNTWTLVMAAAVAATVPLDLLLVPWCRTLLGNGAVAGALSFLVTESGMMVAGLLLLPRGTLGRADLWLALRVMAAGLLMAVAAWYCRRLFIVIPVAVGAAIYSMLALALGLFSTEDRALLARLMRRALHLGAGGEAVIAGEP